MWWWRLFVFAESARRRGILFLLSLKNPHFFMFHNFCGYFSFFHSAIISSYTPLLGLFLNICCMHIGPKEFARWIFLAFSSFFNKIQDGRQNPMSLSRAWTAHGFVSCLVQRNNPTLDVCCLVSCVIMLIKTYTCQDFSRYFSFAHFVFYQNLIMWLYSLNFIFWVFRVTLRK